jgi:hypothetical protein
VIPEIDIWRAATLMLKRYGEKALEQHHARRRARGRRRSRRRRHLAPDHRCVEQLANTTPPGPLH